MNKASSSTSNGGNPPETGDAQDANEETPASTPTPSRASKHWKKIKEISEKEKRAAWKMVNLSTLPKADKEAILRARLLDATKRLKPGRATAATQTDSIPSKLMKEVNIDIQRDLIGKRDVEILTDGAITLKQEGSGELILTNTVAQMADVVLVTEAQTQTATPRITNNFFGIFLINRASMPEDKRLERSLSRNEEKLLRQMKDIAKVERKLNSNYQTESEDSEQSDDSLLENEKNESSLLLKKFTKRKICRSPKNSLRTSRSFNFSDDEVPNILAKRRENNFTWNDVIVQNSAHSPVVNLHSELAKKSILQKKSIIWSDAQHNAVMHLINESKALLDLFEEIGILLGPDLNLNKPPQKENTQIKFISKYWEPIIRKSAQTLEYKLNALQKTPIKKAELIDPEMLENLT